MVPLGWKWKYWNNQIIMPTERMRKFNSDITPQHFLRRNWWKNWDLPSFDFYSFALKQLQEDESKNLDPIFYSIHRFHTFQNSLPFVHPTLVSSDMDFLPFLKYRICLIPFTSYFSLLLGPKLKSLQSTIALRLPTYPVAKTSFTF